MSTEAEPTGNTEAEPTVSTEAEPTGNTEAEPTGGRVVRVIPDVSALRKMFDYTVPPGLDGHVRVGTQVRVALHGRRVGGWVVEDAVSPPPGVSLRPLASVRGWGPPPEVLELARWAAWRWAGPTPALLRTASSATAVRALPPPPRPTPGPTVAGPAPTSPGTTGVDGPGESVSSALSGGTCVLRLGPASDPAPLYLEAATRRRPGADVLVLAPAHHVAQEVAARLRQGGHPVALLPGEWAAARAGGRVVVGTRAAAFAPLPSLSAAVVLDAHDEAYHEERAPTWAAWVVVAERARRDGASCVLVSSCPTLELLRAGRLVTTSRRVERRGWPGVEIVDRRDDDPRTGMFSERLVRLVRWAAAPGDGRRLVCVVNRTGRVRLLACAACGELARCDTCGAALELVGAAGDGAAHLRCRRCTAQRPVVCAGCGATRTRALRLGVTRLAEELAALAGTAVAEVWGPPRRSEAAGVPDAAPVVVGTEAALHRVTRADAVAFLDFDAELLAPRFRAGEQALALLARAGRLVARSAQATAGDRAPGHVLVQTRQPRHPVLTAAVTADPGVLSRAESEVRAALGLPPWRALAVVSGAEADDYGAALVAAAPGDVMVTGPVDGVWSVRAPDHRALCALLASVPRPPGRLRVEVDPVRV